ncbi:MAG: beta family protein [Actinomycetota bacterium]
MQLTISVDGPFEPLPAGGAHYVPVVQNKKGELDALRRAPGLGDLITPMISVVGPATPVGKLSAAQTRSWVKKIEEAVGRAATYVDISRLDARNPIAVKRGSVPVYERLFELAAERGMKAIPVARVGSGFEAHNDMAAGAALRDHRGIALRVPIQGIVLRPGSSFPSLVEETLSRLHIDPAQIDIFVDLEFIDEDLEIDAEDICEIVEGIEQIAEWRNTVLLGTSMPASLSCVPQGSVGVLPRREWDLWRDVRGEMLGRPPVYGDYVVQHPKPPSSGGPGMRANIRYTAEEMTVVARGLSVMEEGKAQYTQLCLDLVDHDDFSGPQFSWGDQTIADCALGRIEPGDQTMWRGAGTSHHLAYVSTQIADLPAAS